MARLDRKPGTTRRQFLQRGGSLAVGAAVLGMVAAGQSKSGFATISEAATAMAAVPDDRKKLVQPRAELRSAYDPLYRKYRQLADAIATLD